MTTGYTEILERTPSVTFREFALRCARACGVCLHMRDASLDVPIPVVFEPETYHRDQLAIADARLLEVKAYTDTRVRELLDEENVRVAKYLADAKAYRAKMDAIYGGMRAKVLAWIPPTKEHDGLKTFMLDQIATSWDSAWHAKQDYEIRPVKSVETMRAELIARAQEDVEYHAVHWAKEVKRAREGTEWMKNLLASLPEK